MTGPGGIVVVNGDHMTMTLRTLFITPIIPSKGMNDEVLG